MNFMPNLFLTGAAGGKPAGRLFPRQAVKMVHPGGRDHGGGAGVGACRRRWQRKTPAGGEHPVQVETPKAATKQLVREPAVAGLFYPKDPAELSHMIDRLLAAAPAEPVGDLKAIICPHAGYEFSGPVAAYSFKNLIGRRYDTVIILGPSHYALFDGRVGPGGGCLSHAARAGAHFSQSPGAGKNQSLPQRTLLSGATSRLVAAVIQAGA